MNDQKSTPLGGEEPQTPRHTLPQAVPPHLQPQLHDPDSPDNLLKSGRPLTAADLRGPSPEDDAELRAAEERIARERDKRIDQPSPGLPPQPELGAPNRSPIVTEIPQGGNSGFDVRFLPGTRKSLEIFQPPEVPITEADLERMLDCIVNNKHYSEVFKKGPIEVLFRVKSAREVDFQRANLSRMASKGEFGLMSDFQAAVARYNQLFQVVSYNGKQVPPVNLPPRPWKVDDLNLEEQYWASWLSDITESAGYMIHGMMIQFEDKVYRMQQRMLDPDFTMPVAPSSSARA